MKFNFPTILLCASVLVASTLNSCGKRKNKTGTFTDDRDGKQYEWVEIGDQVWMSENLAYTGDNGYQTNITLEDGEEAWISETKGAWCYYDDDPMNETSYGVLYQWEAAVHACPEGWHLPTYTEMSDLKDHLRQEYVVSGYYVNSTALCLATDYDWTYSEVQLAVGNDDYPDDRNATGFSALPSGIRTRTSIGFDNQLIDGGKGTHAYFWSSTDDAPYGKYRMAIVYNEPEVFISAQSASDAAACRCIRD